MKSIFITIILLASALLFSTCSKSKKQWKETYVQGHLTEYYTGKPIANTEVVLYGITDQNMSNRYERIVEKTTTDAAGHFSFKSFNAYKANEDTYNIGLKSTNLLLVVDGKVADYSHYITKGENNNMELKAIKKIKYTGIIENVSYLNDSDKICITSDFSADIVEAGEKHPEFCLTGLVNKEYGPNEITANVPIKYNYTVTRNSIFKSYEFTIIPRNDTTFYIKY
jgi:5-hydroxyisourate hydrolase-like protein (transthyretin family)